MNNGDGRNGNGVGDGDGRDKALPCLYAVPAAPIAPNAPNAITVPAPTNKTMGQLRFQNQGSGTISSIWGSYKSAVTKYAHLICPNFAWQSRFHDHIIRDADSFERIRNYIENNPKNWNKDKFFE